MNIRILCGLIIGVAVFVGGCSTTGGVTPAEKRQSILNMRTQVLNDLYKLKPDVQAQVNSAAGYGVFSNANINVIFASFGGGYGIVRDNAAARDTYMKMGEFGLGLGAGAKDFRLVFVYHTRAAMNRFLDSGWTFGAQADAAAKASDKGGAVGGEAIIDDITVYQLTESGLVLQATIKGTKFWKDEELN
ncbi:hypothetical protein FKG94_10585 [Exilibacterium tricleocarpae]|uniref:Ysc84 actin-binding domain-containing protein n=1 Tax=Exilibacterium tricleocarpae TaxID=2591008 RepID=A0A545TSB3_9GAMM|nr:YSC84-related protein [Exilibacterium tricleocarpae]TQV80106.1 hypothetical protein FKG94_10585 [Exilibacterium tricleocarpae]